MDFSLDEFAGVKPTKTKQPSKFSLDEFAGTESTQQTQSDFSLDKFSGTDASPESFSLDEFSGVPKPKKGFIESIKDSLKGSAKMVAEQTPWHFPIAIGETALAPIPGMAMEGATGLSAISPQIIGAKKAYDVVTGKKTIGETAKESLDPRMFLNTSKEIIDTGHELQQSAIPSAINELAQPKTKYGETLLEGVSYPFEKAHEMADNAQEYWEAKGHYNTGFVNKMLLEAAPFLLPYSKKIVKLAEIRGTSPVKVVSEIAENKVIEAPKEPSPEHIAGRVPMEDLPESFKPKTTEGITEGFPDGFSAKKVSTGTVNAYGDKAFKNYEYEVTMPDGKTFGTASLAEAKEFAKNFKDIVNSIQKEITPQGISEQLGKPNQVEVLESMGIKDPIEQKKAIVQDVMRNPQNKEQNLNVLKSIKDNIIESEINKFVKEEKQVKQAQASIPVVDQMYEEATKTIKAESQRGSIEMPASPVRFNIAEKFKKIYSDVKEGWQELGFYKKISKEYPGLVNDIRIDIIGGDNRIAALENKFNTILWAGLKKPQIKLASDILYLKDRIYRTKTGKGVPGETLEALQKKLDETTSKAEPEVISATEKKNKLYKLYQDDLVARGKLSPENVLEDYMAHYTVDYTPDWLPTHGLWRTKLRTPYRSYTKKAKGSIKEYRQDPKTIVDHLLRIEADNLMDDFITKQSARYDMLNTLSKTEKEKMGIGKGGVKPGRVYEDSKGNKYWGYNPKKPFSRTFYPTEEGKLALGGYSETYLVPEKIYKTFENFTPKGSLAWYVTNRATSLWKEAALTTRFVSYNLGNIIGDTHLLLTQHPEPYVLPKYIKQSFDYLRNKKNLPYLNEFKNWLSANDVVGSSFIHEIPRLNEGLRGKLWRMSETREALLRVANGKYLFDKLMEHKGADTVAKFDWIDTHGLPDIQALGKIAREVLVDYQATSKTYNRLIRGFAAPFGRFYFAASSNIWKFARKHPMRFIASMSAIPIACELFNSRSDEIKELESQLPDTIRQSTKFILGEKPDGTVLTLVVQTPQDALIGTKIFTVMSNQIGRVLKGEKSVDQAAIDTLKNWWGKEWRGIVFLQNPIVRFISGMMGDKDPVDKQPIYPIDKNKLSSANQLYYESMFFLKTMTPMLSGYISETQGKVKTSSQAVMSVLDNFAGQGALGLRSFTKRNEVLWDNKYINYETHSKAMDVLKEDAKIILSMRDKFIQSGLEAKDFVQTDVFQSDYDRLVKLYDGDTSAMESADESIQNKLENALTMQLWVDNKIATAQTPEEKKKWGIEKRKYMQEGLVEKVEQLPKRVQKFAIGEK